MMKTKMMWLLLAAMTMLSACSKDEDGGDPNDPNVMRTIKLTTEVNSAINYMFDFEYDTFPTDLSIDWGDGSVTSSYSHRYTTSGVHNIIIRGKNLRWFDNTTASHSKGRILAIDFSDCNSLVGIDLYGDLGEDFDDLDVSGMKALEYLDCSDNWLTSLNIKGCSSLTELDCSSNELSVEALNEIFKNLPQGKTWTDEDGYEGYSRIYFAYNPGSDDCDVSILEKKGWKISRY